MKVLPKKFHLNDNTKEFLFIDSNGRNQNLTIKTSNLFCVLHSIRGVFFSLISESSVYGGMEE